MANSTRALMAAALAIAIGGCGNERNQTAMTNPLDARVCVGSDLGEGYNEETAGNFSPSNLADLGSNSSQRSQALVKAGMLRGHFALWRKVPSQPPFEPRTDVVCQAIEFGTADQADAFVNGLRPEKDSLVTAGIALLSTGTTTVTEEPVPAGVAGARAFSIRAKGSSGDVPVFAVVAATGPYVRSAYLQTPGASDQLEQAVRVLAASIARLP